MTSRARIRAASKQPSARLEAGTDLGISTRDASNLLVCPKLEVDVGQIDLISAEELAVGIGALLASFTACRWWSMALLRAVFPSKTLPVWARNFPCCQSTIPK